MPEQIAYYALFLKKYNNYFNRIIKGFETADEYIAAVGEGNYFLFTKPINYNPADNVSTELIMNDCPFDPDYVLILDKDEEIVARWFILESVFTRAKQRKYSLRRDVVYDNLPNLLDSPMFIQKAMLSDDDPFILNSEGMSFNEIKTSETLLKDRTGSAWIIGYCSKNASATTAQLQVPDGSFIYYEISDLASEAGLTEAQLAALLNFDVNTNEARITTKVEFRYGFRYGLLLERERTTFNGSLSSYGLTSNEVYSWAKPLWRYDPLEIIPDPVFERVFAQKVIANRETILPAMSTITSRTYLNEDTKAAFDKYKGKIFKYNGQYYKFDYQVQGVVDDPVIGPSAFTTWPSIENAARQAAALCDGELIPGGEISIRTKSTVVYLKMDFISAESGDIPGITTKISSSRNPTINQAFDAFAIPYGPAKFKSDLGNREADMQSAISIAAKIATQLDAACYDVQLLPYCPIIDLFDNNNRIDLTALTEDEDFNYIEKSNSTIRKTETPQFTGEEDPDMPGRYRGNCFIVAPVAYNDITSWGYTINYGGNLVYNITTNKINLGATTELVVNGLIDNIQDADYISISIWYEYNGTDHISFLLWIKNVSFSTQLNYSLQLKDSVKIESQCNKYRITSPNYQGSFDFNVARNGGSVPYFIADCTYKPYTPYIKVAPSFGFMYGTNYGDNRGLVCGGDYSLPRFTSAWETYELNNKNYQNIFNRDIQNLDFEQSLDMRQQLITGGIGIFTTGVAGAAAGAMLGGGWGAIPGGIIGHSVSAIGMSVDTDILGKKQREAKQYSIDKFNYQLGNIKALPNTITKVGAFDINSKIWPFLEYYTCTDEEKEALENKITYESMTVMRIGTLRDFISDERHYFKAELIRNETIAEDNHIFEAIYNEFMKGVYI